MNSSRLPGKVLKEICGKSAILHIIERCQQANVDQVVLATSENTLDDYLVAEVTGKCKVIRGSEDDVLQRYYYTARACDASQIIRITGDCPLVDPKLINMVLEQHLNNGCDLTTNAPLIHPTYPDGYDVTCITRQALYKSFQDAKGNDREHVTTYVLNSPIKFDTCIINNKDDLSNYRFTVDYKDDLDVIRKIYNALYHDNKYFGMSDVIEFVKNNPQVMSNTHIRNEGYWNDL